MQYAALVLQQSHGKVALDRPSIGTKPGAFAPTRIGARASLARHRNRLITVRATFCTPWQEPPDLARWRARQIALCEYVRGNQLVGFER